MPGATPKGSLAYSPISSVMVKHTSTVAVRAPENGIPVPQRKPEVGTGLNGFTVEIQILVFELAEINEGTFEGQITVEAITCKNLITGVLIVQMDFVGFNAAYASAKI